MIEKKAENNRVGLHDEPGEKLKRWDELGFDAYIEEGRKEAEKEARDTVDEMIKKIVEDPNKFVNETRRLKQLKSKEIKTGQVKARGEKISKAKKLFSRGKR